VRVLLDENVSPSIVPQLRTDGHDVYHVRDMGLRGLPDHVLWRRAIDEGRILVTINVRDFLKLAEKAELHGGLVTFPSGSTPHEQLSLIRAGLAALSGVGALNRWAKLGNDGSVEITELPPIR